MQNLWITGSNWDEEIPEHLLSEWTCFIDDLPNIENIRIPRWLNSHRDSEIELHGFSESSEKAYAAVIYLRVTTASQSTIVHLISSKTRVAPLKTISLPRLELCGAVLLSKMIKSFRETLRQDCKTILWTDSTITLSWIRSLPHRWKSFVANRIREIIENVGNTEWRHVSSQHNPADIASRGLSSSELKGNSLWWNGPTWLQADHREWPKTILSTSIQGLTEEKKGLKSFHTNASKYQLVERFSDLTHACRVIVYCRRFVSVSQAHLLPDAYPLRF